MKSLLLSSIALAFSISLSGGVIQKSVCHNSQEINISEFNGFDLIRFRDGNIFWQSGYPAIPSVTIYFSIPHTSRLISAGISNANWRSTGIYNVIPFQGYVPIGQDIVWTAANDSIYALNSYFPQQPIVSYGSSSMSGFIVAYISYCPLRYNPVTEELQLMTDAVLTLNYQEGLDEPVYLTSNQMKIFREDVKSIVSNPEDVENNAPFLHGEISGPIEYAIITPEYLVSSFQEIIQWKNQRGIRAHVFSKEWILANYPGYYDDMESIREFVKNLHANHGLIYLVLAGDYDNLGARLAYIVYKDEYGSPDWTPCDQYFSDIHPYNQNWDGNGNHIYGEFQVDGCDWASDVFVGRLPVNTEEEVALWTDKIISYEREPEQGYHERALFAGALLWEDYNYFGHNICDSIADNHLPESWLSTKMYQYGDIPPMGFIDSFNQGYNWSYIASHGWIDGTFWGIFRNDGGEKILHKQHAFLNGMKLGVLHCMACHPGHFDGHECLAEHIFNSPLGGAIAIMMNARFGFGSPPEMGPSEKMDLYIVKKFFDEDMWNIGRAFGFGKNDMIKDVNLTRIYHWCFCEYNLFGDPETDIYTAEPQDLSATHDTIIYMGEGLFDVNLSSIYGPGSGALCCLYRLGNPDVWFRDTSISNSTASIYYNLTSPGPLYFTASCHNHKCYIDTIEVYPRPFWPTFKYPYFQDWDYYPETQGIGSCFLEKNNGEFFLSYSTDCANYTVLDENGNLITSGNYLTPTVLKRINSICPSSSGGYVYGGSNNAGFVTRGTVKIVGENYSIVSTSDFLNGEVHSVIKDSENCYIASGERDGKCWMGKFRIEEETEIVWIWQSQNLSWGLSAGCFYSVIENSEGDLVAVGRRVNGGSCFYKISKSGVLLDSATYQDVQPGEWAGSYGVAEDDNEFIMVGKNPDGSGGFEGYIQCVNHDGDLKWRNEYPETECLKWVYISNSSDKIISTGTAIDPYLGKNAAVIIHLDGLNHNSYYLTSPFGNLYDPDNFITEAVMIKRTHDDGYAVIGSFFEEESQTSKYVFSKFNYVGTDNMTSGIFEIAESPIQKNVETDIFFDAFSGNTYIRMAIPFTSRVEISVYNVLGQKVKVVEDNYLDPGLYSYNWFGDDNRGTEIAPGKYFVWIKAGDYNTVKPINVLR